jgi:hypothetical protein
MILPRSLTPTETAACLVTIIERRGGIFTLRSDDTFWLDLDASDITSHDEAATFIDVVLVLRDEVRAVLVAQRVRH